MTLAPWLEPLPDAARQRALDGWAIEQRGIPGLELMERAGAGLAELTGQLVGRGRIAVVCGKGNNGGDGLVVARLLRELGREVDVLLVGDADELRGDARTNLERLPGAPPRPFEPGALDGAAGIVDAILGTGATGAPQGAALRAVEAIVAAGAGAAGSVGAAGAAAVRSPTAAGSGAAGSVSVIGAAAAGRRAGAVVIACDVPSGVDASTGEVAGAAVRATATATFHAAKPGLWIAPGKQHAGAVTVVEIGIPPDGRPPARGGEAGLIADAVLDELPARGAGSTKFDGGSVLVCGGSAGLTGAPRLASAAAARAGAGYVTVLVPRSLELVFELAQAEVMSVGLPDADGALTPAAVDAALARVARADALVLGPGLGRAEGALAFARALAAGAQVPLLLDADGLNAHAGALEALAARTAPTVLTPHGGELARLLGVDSDAVRTHRLELARSAALRSGAIVVLKGDDTIVAQPDPDAAVAVSRGGAPALATAGTGDVLSGTIGALLARGVEPFRAACAGVELHRRAGRLVGERVGVEGAIASDVVQALPAARRTP